MFWQMLWVDFGYQRIEGLDDMKRLVVYALLLLSAVSASAQEREFVTLDGNRILGVIASYDMGSDMVTIETFGKKKVSMKAANFRDEDFIFIRDWDAVRLFSQNTHFRMYVDGPLTRAKFTKYLWRRPPGKIEPYVTFSIDHERVGYDVKIDNMTGYDLENVEFKYCIYYEQERMDSVKEEKVADLVVRPSVVKYAIMPNASQKRFESNTVVLRHKEFQHPGNFDYLAGDGRFLRKRMIGMVLRVSMKTKSGQAAVREIRMPKDLSEEYAWVEPTPENTVWPDDALDDKEDTRKPPTFFEEMGGKESDEGS